MEEYVFKKRMFVSSAGGVFQAKEADTKRRRRFRSRGDVSEAEERRFKGRRRRRRIVSGGGVVQVDEVCLEWRRVSFQETEAFFKRERRVSSGGGGPQAA